MTLTPHTLWIKTRNYVRAQMPGAGEKMISDVARKVYEEMEFLVLSDPTQDRTDEHE